MLKIGDKIIYKNQTGIIKDLIFVNNHLTQRYGLYIIKDVLVQFDKRWLWSMDSDRFLILSYLDIKKIKNRIFSELDPFGEENWDD